MAFSWQPSAKPSISKEMVLHRYLSKNKSLSQEHSMQTEPILEPIKAAPRCSTTLCAWSAISQVADLINNWHKSQEASLSSQKVLGY